MSNVISKKYYLELDTKTFTPYINPNFICKRNDSILFYITVKADGEILDLTGCKISLVSARCDGSLIEHTIKDYKLEDGVLIFSPKKSFLDVPSTLLNELVISDEDESITTQSFKFSVCDLLEGDYVNGDEIQDDIDTLEELRRMLDEYNQALIDINAEIENINADIVNINTELENIHVEIDEIHDRLESVTDGYATIAFVNEEIEKTREEINNAIEEGVTSLDEKITTNTENIATNAIDIKLIQDEYAALKSEFDLFKDSAIIIDDDAGIHTDIEVQL